MYSFLNLFELLWIRLLVVVRDPVTRAISDYAQAASKRKEMKSFEDLAFLNQTTGIIYFTINFDKNQSEIECYIFFLVFFFRCSRYKMGPNQNRTLYTLFGTLVSIFSSVTILIHQWWTLNCWSSVSFFYHFDALCVIHIMRTLKWNIFNIFSFVSLKI